MSFEIKAIPLMSIVDTAGCTIDVSVDKRDEKVVVLFAERPGRKFDYFLSTLIVHAIGDCDAFEITDGFDGTQNINIHTEDIQMIVRRALTILPRFLGEFVVSVDYVPNNPDLPF